MPISRASGDLCPLWVKADFWRAIRNVRFKALAKIPEFLVLAKTSSTGFHCLLPLRRYIWQHGRATFEERCTYCPQDRLLLFGVRDFTKRGLVGLVDSFLNAPVEQVGERHRQRRESLPSW